MNEGAYLVQFGNSLSVLCRDQGQAEKTLVSLHGHGIKTLWDLTDVEIEYLRQMPKEKPCDPS